MKVIVVLANVFYLLIHKVFLIIIVHGAMVVQSALIQARDRRARGRLKSTMYTSGTRCMKIRRECVSSKIILK